MLPRCLVLNNSYEYLTVCSWFDAFCLVFENKAFALAEYDDVVRSQYTSTNIPSVVVMKYFVKLAKRKNSFNIVSKKNLLIRDNFKCGYCETPLSMSTCTVDHVIPRAKGGTNGLDNTVAACKTCNNRKGDMSLDAFLKMQNLSVTIKPRQLTEEEKIKCLLKTVKSKERNAWVSCLKDNNIQLW